MLKNSLSLSVAVLLLITTAQAQDKFCKVWTTSEGASKVEIFLTADGTYGGKIVWLRDGFVNGKPLIDSKNPDASKRSATWLGLQIITGLVRKSATEIIDGKIYDPQHGNFYNCKMTITESGKLELRGYILGMPFLGRTTTWYLSPEDDKPAKKSNPEPTSAPTVVNPTGKNL